MHTQRNLISVAILLPICLVCVPSAAQANAGFYTWLLFAPALWWITVLPVMFEWWAIKRWLNLTAVRALWVVLAANLLSTVVGAVALGFFGLILDFSVLHSPYEVLKSILVYAELLFVAPIVSSIVEYPVFLIAKRELLYGASNEHPLSKEELQAGFPHRIKAWQIVLLVNMVSNGLAVAAFLIGEYFFY